MNDRGEPTGEDFLADRDLVEGILRTSPVGITVVDGDGTVTFANERAEEIYGRSTGEIDEFSHDDSRWDLVDEDGEPLEPGAAPFDRVVERGETIYDQVLGLRRPSGERVWVSVNGAPRWNDEDGELERAVFAFEDITDRKERERELERKERRFEAVFEDPNILVGLLEPDGTVVDINQTAMEYIDADLEDVTDEPFWETPWWGEGDGVRDDVREWTERAAEGEYVDFEADLTRPDGEPYTLSGYFRPVTDDDGDVVSIIVSDRDITERRKRERELEESERRYRTLVENFPNGAVALVDENIRYRTVGGTPTDTGDVTAEEAEGSLVAEAVPPALAEDLVPAYEAAFEGESTTFEAESDGRIYQFHVVPVRDDDGEIFAALGMSQDLTEREEAKRKLAESERRYRTLVEQFPNGAVGLFDEDLRYQVVGGQAFDDVGASQEEIAGKTLWERYPDDVAERLEPKFRAALEGTSDEFEWEYHGRHWHAYTIPIRDERGDVYAGMIMVQDVTERKRMEQELRESEAKFRMLAENIDEIVWMTTPDAREFLYVNPAYEDVYGQDREVLYEDSRAFEAALHPEDRERALDAWEKIPEEMYDEEFRVVRPDGEIRWVHAQTTRVHDEDGDVTRIVGIANDVTERRERERQLEKSERRYRTLADHFPNGVVGVYDRELRYTLAAGEKLGDPAPSAEEVEGTRMPDLYPDEAVADLEPLFRAAIEDGETGSVQTEVVGRKWRVWATPLRNADGEIFAGLSFAQDITEQVEREERLEELVEKLEESNERLEQFAYAASHDLQEPLRMVSSYLQLIEDRYGDDLDQDGREFIEYAVDGAERMRDMIDALLEYSRVETRGDPFEPVDLDAVLADVREDLQVKIEESDAEVTVEDLPRVEGDPSQLRQVFQNLLENALEYSGDEPPRVHVAAEPDRTGSGWRISVEDEGIGIDPDDQDRIFEVFQRLHSRDEKPGTGIGLALCERIVERHGGDIRVDSEPGDGTTFSLTLPAADDPDR